MMMLSVRASQFHPKKAEVARAVPCDAALCVKTVTAVTRVRQPVYMHSHIRDV
jgi:hypothetical protein